MTRRVGLGDRGRVPFALAGVLLVVSSALFAASVGPRSHPPEPAVDLAMERTAADARATLRQAVARAGVAAASDPVTARASTAYGRVLGANRTFRDALKLRIYLRARQGFASVGRTHRGVRTTVSLPETPSPEALDRALDRVSVSRAGPNGTGMSVTVRGITQTARDDGRIVGRRNRTLTVQVDSPVLAVHDRVEEFEERLNASLTEPGLAGTTTSRLYAAAWARGYAQYGGAPIENVVANRHVGVVTNGAVLSLQRSVFGRSDPDGRSAHARATAALAVTEVTGGLTANKWVKINSLVSERLRSATEPGQSDGVTRPVGSGVDSPKAGDEMEVRVGEAADRAFAPYARSEPRPDMGPYGHAGSADWRTEPRFRDPRGVEATIRSVFNASVRTLGRSTRASGGTPARPGRPDEPGDWSLEEDDVETDVASVAKADAGPSVAVPDGYHRLYEYHRLVTLDHERERTWEYAGDEETTRTERTETRRVTVAVVGRHAPTRYAPDRRIRQVHTPAGPFDGPNLANVTDRVNETVVAARGGLDGLAGATAKGEIDERPTTVHGEWPPRLEAWAYRDLVELRERVRAMSVEVERGKLGTFQANPPARLLERLRERRPALLDAPARYDHVAHTARVELRGQYLARVARVLEYRARKHERRGRALNRTLSKHTDTSLSMLRRGLAARRIEARKDSGRLRMTVDGAPPYLTLTGVTHEQVSAVEPGTTYHPMVAENVNLGGVPYGDATDTVLNGIGAVLSGSPHSHLRTGVQALDSVDSAYRATGNESLAANRSTLRAEIDASLADARGGIEYTLQQHGVLELSVRREIAASAFDRYDSDRARALAVSNLSIVDDVVAATAAHPATNMTVVERDRLRVDLRDRLNRALETDGVGVSGAAVTAATVGVKSAVGHWTEEKLTGAIEQRFNRSMERMPAGIPLLPPYAGWYATTNVWVVNVQGRYARFAVEAPRRTPAAADASLAYVRDGENVTLDVDDDGTGERLGRNEHVSFDVRTAVVVVVPPGRTGVGDIDGNYQERSAGWPLAGPERRTPDRTVPDSPGHAPGPRFPNGSRIRDAGRTVRPPQLSNYPLARPEATGNRPARLYPYRANGGGLRARGREASPE